jgi:hypothetical protein
LRLCYRLLCRLDALIESRPDKSRQKPNDYQDYQQLHHRKTRRGAHLEWLFHG